jgi:hypothetical protein
VRSRLSVKIRNETEWRTSDLRRLIKVAHARVFDPGQKPVVYVRVVGARSLVGGCAFVGGCNMTVRLPAVVTDTRVVGAILVHELGHVRGLHHRDMRGAPRWTWRGVAGDKPYDQWLAAHEWARALPLRKVEVKPKPAGLVLVAVKRERAAQALVRWTRKAKLAATKIRKLRVRLRYYDKRAAAGSGP